MSSELNTRQRNAAELLARGDATQQAVALRVGVRPETMTRWLALPAFVEHLETEREAIRAAIRAEGIVNKQNRIDAYNERWLKMQTVIAERAESPDMQQVPGGKTGLLVKTWKQVGSGPDAQLVAEYSVDTGTLAEMRATEKQAGQELGQWVDKSESYNQNVSLGLVGIRIEDI
jgi:transposase-like protein